MEIIRPSLPQDNYTVISTDALEDPRLDFLARGLLLGLLALPDGSPTPSAHSLYEGHESVEEIQAALDELVRHGYLDIRDGDWIVTDTPSALGGAA